jgi:hypothetical protein
VWSGRIGDRQRHYAAAVSDTASEAALAFTL